MAMFWNDIPGATASAETCYAKGCQVRTTGGGARDDHAVSLCEVHRSEEYLEEAIADLITWKGKGA